VNVIFALAQQTTSTTVAILRVALASWYAMNAPPMTNRCALIAVSAIC
jgi:hypothetical protein